MAERKTDIFIVSQHLATFELCNAMLSIFLNSKYIKRFFAFGFFCALLSVILSYSSNTGSDAKLLATILSPLVILCLLAVFIYIASLYITRAKPGMLQNVVYRFTPLGLERKGIGFEFKRPWREVKSMRETSHFFLLYISEFDAHIIQKRMFGSKGEVDEFRSFIERLMPHK